MRDRENPQLTGSVPVNSMAIDVDVSENIAAVIDQHYGTRFIDVSDPQNPHEVGYYDLNSRYQDVAVCNNLVFITTRTGLVVYDHSDPDNLVERGTIDIEDGTKQVVTSNTWAAISTDDFSISFVDFTDPDELFEITRYNLDDECNDLKFQQDMLIVAVGEEGVIFFDTTNPEDYREIQRIEFESEPVKIFLHDEILSVATIDSVAYLCNIANIDNPEILSSIEAEYEILDIVHNDEKIWIGRASETTLIYDIENLEYPVFVGYIYPSSQDKFNFVLEGDYLHLNGNGSYVIVWQGTHRILRENLPYAGSAGIAVRDNYVYLSKWERFLVLDIEEPKAVKISLPNIPQNLILDAYPNPFNSRATISYSLPTPGNVTLSIYNTRGQRVQTLVNGKMQAGEHNATFSAGDLPSGLYLVHLQYPHVNGGFRKGLTQKIMLIK